nr:hypothetical protein BHM03_00029805 [Ipomoea batatas]
MLMRLRFADRSTFDRVAEVVVFRGSDDDEEVRFLKLDSILLGALIALPFLLPMLSAEVFLDPSKVPQSSRRVMVNAALLRAYIHLLLDHLLVVPLLQLPWQIVPSPVQLQILVPLETLVADFAYEPALMEEVREERASSDDIILFFELSANLKKSQNLWIRKAKTTKPEDDDD